MMMASSATNDDNKKKSDVGAAPAPLYVKRSKEDIEREIANSMWIANTEVRAQMQKEVAAESGIDESYAAARVLHPPSRREGVPLPHCAGPTRHSK